MSAPDRLEELRAQTAVTGIDFVYVHEDQVTLDVHFHSPPAALDISLVGDLTLDQVSIFNAYSQHVRVDALAWALVDGDDVLRLTTGQPGDFTLYRMRIEDQRIDPYFNEVAFSFKANCPSDLDCEPAPHKCPPEALVDFLVDYRARDFWSFRRALLEFADQRYPDWKDRLEADAGVMIAEMLSALGDELAYYQDRVGREAYLETATQRRSVRRHARLVDYEVHDGLAGQTWLDVSVMAGMAGVLPAGTDVWAESDDGGRIDYEIGKGLAEIAGGETHAVDANRNSLSPHIWDEDHTCLRFGETEMFLKGHQQALLPFDDTAPGATPGRWVLLMTTPASADLSARRWLVRLVQIEEIQDPLINDPVFGHDITRVVWEQAQALPFELDLDSLELRGNLVPAIAGRTFKYRYLVGMDPDDPSLGLPLDEQALLTRAIERKGPGNVPIYLLSEPDSLAQILNQDGEPFESIVDTDGLVIDPPVPEMLPATTPLCWNGERAEEAHPEARLAEVSWDGAGWVEQVEWTWRRSFLGSPSSQPEDRHFSLDDGTWRRVVGFFRNGQEIIHRDYATNDGVTVRFGEGEFGLPPSKGTVFELTYRLGNDRRGNLTADTLSHFDDGDPALGFLEAVTNPLPIENGQDPQTLVKVRQLAPEAFRAITYRAVRPEDYAEAAERLLWVDRAGAAFRWTGSWQSAFVTPDPRGAVSLTIDQRAELTDQVDRFRQAGREAFVADPVYADIDLEIRICVEPSSYPGQVKERVLKALLGEGGFFSPDNFTFGTPLRRSRLEATIDGVPGVRAVEGTRIRRRGVFDWRDLTGPHYPIGDSEVIRLENDPLRPERGSLRLVMEGGA